MTWYEPHLCRAAVVADATVVAIARALAAASTARYLLLHAADDANAPYVARRLHEQLAKLNPFLPKLPDFESDHGCPQEQRQQLDLF